MSDMSDMSDLSFGGLDDFRKEGGSDTNDNTKAVNVDKTKVNPSADTNDNTNDNTKAVNVDKTKVNPGADTKAVNADKTKVNPGADTKAVNADKINDDTKAVNVDETKDNPSAPTEPNNNSKIRFKCENIIYKNGAKGTRGTINVNDNGFELDSDFNLLSKFEKGKQEDDFDKILTVEGNVEGSTTGGTGVMSLVQNTIKIVGEIAALSDKQAAGQHVIVAPDSSNVLTVNGDVSVDPNATQRVKT